MSRDALVAGAGGFGTLMHAAYSETVETGLSININATSD